MARQRSDSPYITGPEKHRQRWRIRVHSRRDDGTRQTIVRSFSTEKEAIETIRAFKVVRAASDKTIGDAVALYLASLARKGNKPNSIVSSEWKLKRILDFDRPLSTLNERAASAAYEKLIASKAKTDTHRGSLMTAKALSKFCVKHGLLTRDVFLAVEPAGKKERGKNQLTIDEAIPFIAFCLAKARDDRDTTAIAPVLALMFGLRATEITGLVGRDVDNNGGVLLVAERDGKTKSARRRQIIPAMMRPLMQGLKRVSENNPGGFLFINERGVRPAKDWPSWHTKRLCALAGVPIVCAHGLRGTHTTILKEAGTATNIIAQSVGHSSPTMTERHYIAPGTVDQPAIDRVIDLLMPDELNTKTEGENGELLSLKSSPQPLSTIKAKDFSVLPTTKQGPQAPETSASTNSATFAIRDSSTVID